jgi:hypothetical protein
METIEDNAMLTLLNAFGPDPEYADQLDLYGQFVGSWDIDNRKLDLDTGEWLENTAHWHFGWTLGGRAIQDTLEFGGRPGTTVRLYNPKRDAWRVVWFAPSVGDICVLEGRRDGERIFQEGTQPDGARIRWIFSEISADRFLWRGYLERAGDWILEQEMRAHRR